MDKISVLDFGGQYAHLISRRVREMNVYADVKPSDAPFPELMEAKGLILSGGPGSVYEEGAPAYDPGIFSGEIQVLGICYGMQLMAHHLGGRVARGSKREYGKTPIRITNNSQLLEGLDSEETVWMSHGDSVLDLPDGFEVLAISGGLNASIGDGNKRLYGVQFHPEVTHTPKGRQILRNFVYRISGCGPGWTMENYVDDRVERIRQQVGKGRALVYNRNTTGLLTSG